VADEAPATVAVDQLDALVGATSVEVGLGGSVEQDGRGR
jgi:hypothetical protein